MTTLEPSPQTDWLQTELPSMSSAAVSRVRISAPPERVLVLQARDPACGVNSIVSFAKYDPATSSWRTSQRCLVEGLERFSETFAHMGSGGRTSKQPPTGKRPSGTKQQLTLNNAAKWSTPTSRDHKTGQLPTRDGGDSLPVQAGGSLNPAWVEGLMGFPFGWTDLSGGG